GPSAARPQRCRDAPPAPESPRSLSEAPTVPRCEPDCEVIFWRAGQAGRAGQAEGWARRGGGRSFGSHGPDKTKARPPQGAGHWLPGLPCPPCPPRPPRQKEYVNPISIIRGSITVVGRLKFGPERRVISSTVLAFRILKMLARAASFCPWVNAKVFSNRTS